MTTTDANRHPSINFDETELRLGLPGGRGVDKADAAAAEISKSRSNGKRGFSETEIVDLKLHLSSSSTTGIDEKEKVVKPPAKAQVVGWPPVRSFRKNAMATQKANTESATGKADGSNGPTTTTTATTAALVKVSMDGAPYLRKVDLKTYKSYQELSNALVTMFSSFASDKKDSISHSKSTDSRNGSDFVPTYEDKDGDWMLVGDVPWEMFVESCKRMRIMTSGSEALRS